MKLYGHCYTAADTLVIISACARIDRARMLLLGKWINHRVVARRPAIVSDRLPAKRHGDDQRNRRVRGCGLWRPATTSTGQYQVIAPNTLKITEELGSTVVGPHVDGTRLVLSGDDLERLLGKTEPPQELYSTRRVSEAVALRGR